MIIFVNLSWIKEKDMLFYKKNYILEAPPQHFCNCSVYQRVVLWPWCQIVIFSTIKIRLALKFESFIFKIKRIMSIFRLSRWCQILILKKFWNPEIILKFWDFSPNFCMWPLNMQTNKCYIATWGQRWLLPWYLRGGLWGPPPCRSHRIW